MEMGELLARRLSRIEASDIREILKLTEGRQVISLAGGLPDPRVFPREELAEITREIIEERGEAALQYSPTRGVTAFLEVLRGFLAQRGVRVAGDDGLLVATGSQEALFLAGLALVNPGDIVVVEKPTYLAAVNVFRFFQARLVPVRLDEEGMDTVELERVLREAEERGERVKMVYTVPTAQNPSGVSMSMERRRHLMELASAYDLLVIEDDPYSYFMFEETDFTFLKTLDTEGRVLYLGTSSKILTPGLRLGWAVGPEPIIAAMETAKQTVDLHSSTLSQFIAMEAMKRGIVDRTARRAREIYREKRDAMLEEMEAHFPRGTRWTRPVGGFFSFVYLPEGMDAKEMLPEAVEKYQVAYVPGYSFYVDGTGRNTMRLSFSFPPVDVLREGVRRLARFLQDKMK